MNDVERAIATRKEIQVQVDKLYYRIHEIEQEIQPLEQRLHKLSHFIEKYSRDVEVCEIDEAAAKLMLPALRSMGKDVRIVHGTNRNSRVRIMERVIIPATPVHTGAKV